MSATEAVLVWGALGLLALFVGTLWVVQGRMLRRERAREKARDRELGNVWSRVFVLERQAQDEASVPPGVRAGQPGEG